MTDLVELRAHALILRRDIYRAKRRKLRVAHLREKLRHIQTEILRAGG